MKNLSRAPKLTSLFLEGTPITDAGLNPLADCKSLKSLTLKGTKVTDQGMNWLKERLPACSISR